MVLARVVTRAFCPTRIVPSRTSVSDRTNALVARRHPSLRVLTPQPRRDGKAGASFGPLSSAGNDKRGGMLSASPTTCRETARLPRSAPRLIAVHLLRLLALSLLFPAAAIAGLPTARYVNSKDPTCGGRQPCYATIQTAVNAAGAGDTVQIQAGRYREQVSVEGKNSSSAAIEADRIIIEADPFAPVGSVVLVGAVSSCSDGHALRVQQSNFVTVRGMTITGARGAAVLLLGGAGENNAVHIERNRIVRNGRDQCNTGIMVGSGNSATVIVNNLIYGNAGDGIRFDGASEGPHYVVNNTIHDNAGNGIRVSGHEHVLLVNNAIALNGGSGVRGDSTALSDSGRIELLHNLLCRNHLREIDRPVMDGADRWNLTPTGREGPGAMPAPDCANRGSIYAHRAGPDGQLNTEDDDFTLATGSPAIGQGIDPRTLGLEPDLDSLFEADFLSPGARAVGGADGGFDIGAIAFETPGPSDQPPQVTIVTPHTASFIRGGVSIRAEVRSHRRVANVTLRAGSRALPSTLESVWPGPVTTATGNWSTKGVPNGVHTLTATATDSAGQTTTATHVAIVDNTPPDTRIVGGPEGTIKTTETTFLFDGGDDLTSPTNVKFAWQLDRGPFTAFASASTASLTGLTAGRHTFTVKARDQAGNEDPTPARRDFTVSPTSGLKTYALTISLAGKGSGTVTGAGTYPAGTVVGLKATPAAGSTFMGWSPAVCSAGVLTMPAALVACVATFGVATPQGPPSSSGSPVTVTLGWAGTLRDKVGQNYGVIGDGALDGTFTMTFSGAQTVRQVVVARSPAGSGMWDTIVGNPPWTLGVAKSLDTPLLNLANGALPSVPVTATTVWSFFASDMSPSLFTPGTVFTVTATFSDGTTAAATATIPPTPASSPSPTPASSPSPTPASSPSQPSASMPWADRAAQPGVLTAVQMSSWADIQSGGNGTTAIIRPEFMAYDATENALLINVLKEFGTPALTWTKSLPYAQQFDAHSEMWVQLDVKWDAGMLAPSNGGGGIKFFTVDEGIQPDGFNPGSCDNGGKYPMQGQIVGHTNNVRTAPFPTLYSICNVYEGLYEPLPDGDTALENKVPNCTYRLVNANPFNNSCFRLKADVWYTFTLRVKIGTWSPTDSAADRARHRDSQLDFWVSRAGLPAPVHLVSQKDYALVNYSPGQGRYGKLWLLPYDTGRVNSTVDGRVWYRNVLMASQPLKDPLTGTVLAQQGATPSPASSPSASSPSASSPSASSPSASSPSASSPSASSPPASSPPPVGGTLQTIADNGWLAITPNPSSRYLVSQYNPGPGGTVAIAATPTVQASPNARGYSGITVGGGLVAYFGGGHGGWPGNDVEIYDPATNLWTQSYKPEVCLNITAPCGGIYGGSTSMYRTPLNRPYVEQTYQKNLWNPFLQRFQMHTRGVGVFRYDHFAKTFTPVPLVTGPNGVNHPWGGDIGHEHSFWSPDLNDVLTVISTGGVPSGVWRQNGGPGSVKYWQVVAGWPAELTGHLVYSTYVDSRRQHLVMTVSNGQCGQPKHWRWFNPLTMQFTPAAMPAAMAGVDYVEYDSKNDRLVALQDCANPIKMWVGTPDAVTWTPITLTTAPPSNAVAKGLDTTAALPTLQYDRVNNVFWYLHVEGSISLGSLAKLYAYRYRN